MKKILMLTTDRTLSEVLKEKLSDLSFDVKTLSKSDNIFNAINEFGPDLLLIDLILHDNNGGAICHQVKCEAETHALPVIMLVEHPEFGIFSRKFGCNASVSKPINFTELIGKINGCIQSHKPLFTGKQSMFNMHQNVGVLQY